MQAEAVLEVTSAICQREDELLTAQPVKEMVNIHTQ